MHPTNDPNLETLIASVAPRLDASVRDEVIFEAGRRAGARTANRRAMMVATSACVLVAATTWTLGLLVRESSDRNAIQNRSTELIADENREREASELKDKEPSKMAADSRGNQASPGKRLSSPQDPQSLADRNIITPVNYRGLFEVSGELVRDNNSPSSAVDEIESEKSDEASSNLRRGASSPRGWDVSEDF